MAEDDGTFARGLRALLDGEASPPPPTPNPEDVPLYGGLTGVTMDVPEFTVVPGLVVRETFAHVFGTYMVAFSQPHKPGAPHPGPWVAAQGGVGFDVRIEVALDLGIRPTGLNRLNTLWWFLALLRLRTGAGVRMPVVSTAPYAAVAMTASPPTMWAIETTPRQLRTVDKPPPFICLADLEWVSATFNTGAVLMKDAAFNRAFQLLDSAVWAHDPRAAMTLVWSAIEAVLRPGRQGVGKTLAKCLAVFFETERRARDRTFAAAMAAYESRGGAAHAGQMPELDALLTTFGLARRFFALSLERSALPTAEALMRDWANGAVP